MTQQASETHQDVVDWWVAATVNQSNGLVDYFRDKCGAHFAKQFNTAMRDHFIGIVGLDLSDEQLKEHGLRRTHGADIVNRLKKFNTELHDGKHDVALGLAGSPDDKVSESLKGET